MTNQVAVHASQESEQVVRFVEIASLNEETQKAISNGWIFGLFEKDGQIFAQDVWGDVSPAQ